MAGLPFVQGDVSVVAIIVVTMAIFVGSAGVRITLLSIPIHPTEQAGGQKKHPAS